jgi:hypothetical protein
VKSKRLALGLFVGLFLLGLVAYLGKRPPSVARPVAEPAKSSVAPAEGLAVGDRFSPEGMLAEADRFVDDAAFRRAELERAFTNPKNSYSKERLANYGLGKKGWDLLPEWNPRSVVATDTRNAESLMAGPVLWDGKRPKTMEAWVALGREVFFRYPMRADVVAKYALEHPAEAATRGVVRLPDGTYPGLVHFVDIDGKEALGITCALCHSSSDGSATRLLVGEARRSFDFGALRLAYAASVKGNVEPELARRMRLWGPGRADVTEDDDEDPVAIPDLWGLRHQTHLTQAGTIRHEGPSALAIRQETQLLTSNHQKIRPPRVLAFALALFVYTLDGRTDPPPNHPGQPLFAQHCARCHANTVRGGDLVSAVNIGTDSALAVGQARGTGYYRTPALVRVKHGAPFLHHGAVKSVRELLSPERVLPGYHAGAVGDGPVPGHVFGTELPAAEREMLAGYVEAL